MAEILDEANLLRLVWHPSHFDGGKLKGSAFSSEDLLGLIDENGSRRYVSVDERIEISQESVDWRIDWQQREGRDVRLGRSEARFVVYSCSEVRECIENGNNLFEVSRFPVVAGANGEGSPENLAHCGIQNALKDKVDELKRGERRTHVEMLRVQLLKLKREIIGYCQVFS